MVTDSRLKKILSQIIENIKTKYNPEKIILYGSFAYGVPNENSDIDLLIIKETSERPLDRMALVHRIVDIRDSSYPAFSPIVLTPDEIKQRLEIGDQFIEEILTRGELLYVS
jgi:predicted nucleotidyltransferase